MLKKLGFFTAAAALVALSSAALAAQPDYNAWQAAPPGYVVWPSLPIAAQTQTAAQPAQKQPAQKQTAQAPRFYDTLTLAPTVGN